ncbi:hypothetical protein NKJ36_24980 [Mesorhizobium sp. M0142]|uniref:hypothetical protein n=1 Tax=unclassified Mesorhizobium TaxID=325217 RepID=UPI00333555BE
MQKKLRPRFAFLCEHIEECVPLVPQTAEMGIQLLWEFVQHHNVKANFRNSVNDMMILATAIALSERLLTDENLLTRFAAAQREAPLRELDEGVIEIDFERHPGQAQPPRPRARGYINRGWRIAMETRRRAPQA